MTEKDPTGLSSPGSPRPQKRVPWWASVLMAIVSYCTLKYAVPQISPTNPVLQQVIQAAPVFAPLVTIFFLLLAAKQLYDSDLGNIGSDRSNDERDGGQ